MKAMTNIAVTYELPCSDRTSLTPSYQGQIKELWEKGKSRASF
jgi:hypothetical protein